MGDARTRDLRRRLDAGLEGLDLAPDPDQRDRLVALVLLLERWNRAYNLTAVRDPLEMVSRHLLDSLSVLPFLFGDSVLDVGTGAGLPGLPLAIVAPERRFWLLDSNGKKTRFVRQAAMELGLTNVTVIKDRMESYRTNLKFATIVSRAVASLPAVLTASAHLLSRPSRVLAMKGRYPADEFGGITPHPDAVEVRRLQVPFLDGERHLIEIFYD